MDSPARSSACPPADGADPARRVGGSEARRLVRTAIVAGGVAALLASAGLPRAESWREALRRPGPRV